MRSLSLSLVSLLLTFSWPLTGIAQDETSKTSDATQVETENAEENGGEEETGENGEEEIKPPRKLEKNSEGIYDLTFDDIKFEMEIGSPYSDDLLTDNIRLLDGEEITLRGFIRPGVRSEGLTKFIFVRDNQECCFGPGAALYDCVLVSLDKEHTTDFTVRAVTVTGKFYVKEYKVRDNTLAIYRMRGAKVK